MRGIVKLSLVFLAVFFLVFSTNLKADEIKTGTGQETHSVVKGDTLWDLSGEFYTNPFLWPVLWSRNPQVTNPHLIYPEDLINLKPVEQKKRIIEKVIVKEVIKEIPVIEIVEIEPEPEVEVVVAVPEPEPEPVPELTISDLVDKNVLSSIGYFTYSQPEKLALVQGGFEGLILLEKGRYIYLDRGTEHGFQKGNQFSIVSIEEGFKSREITHSGYIVKVRGEVIIDEVLSDNQSVGVITEDYGEIMRGNLLVPKLEIDGNAKINSDAPNFEDMRVIGIREGLVTAGERSIVYLNKGSEDGLKPGYRYTVFRKEYSGKHAKHDDMVTRFAEEKVGELTVLYTREDTATAVLTSSLGNKYINDREVVFSDNVRIHNSDFYKR
jgi:hypothetical protein